MTGKRALLALLLLGAAAGSCKTTGAGLREAVQTPPADASYYETMTREAPAAPLAGEAEYRAVAEALRPLGPMTFARFSAENGGAVAHGVTMAFGTDFAVGVKIDELRLYGVDATKISDGGAVAARIDAKGVSTFGLERAIGGAMGAYADAVVDVMGAADDSTTDETSGAMRAAAAVTRAVFLAERLVADGLVLHAPDAAPSEPSTGPFMAMLQFAAVQARAVSLDGLAISDLRYEFSGGSASAPMALNYAVPLAGYRGLRRGDFDEALLKDLQWSLSSSAPAGEGTPLFAMTMSGGADLYSITGVRLAKLLDYAAKGVSPPASATDLLSLGVWRSVNERATMNGAPIYAVGESFADLSRFHWYLPASIKLAAENFSFNFGDYLKAATAMVPAEAPDAVAAKAQTEAMLAALERHDLSTLRGSYSASYDWAPKTGRMRFAQDSDLTGLGRFEVAVDARLPDFRDFSALAGETPDLARLTAAFNESTLDGFSLRIADVGLLARAFALGADMQMQQAQNAGLPTDQVPAAADMRAAIAAAMRESAGAASPMSALMSAIGDFIANGGVLTVVAKPKPPLPFIEIGKPGPDGADPVARLGLAAKAAPPE